MKRIHIYLTLAFAAILSLTGCYERYVTYSDKEYVMFADTMAVYPVQAKGAKDKDGNVIDSTFRIPIVSTVVRDYDRTFGVEIIDKGSNAIEKKHYRLESNTVTIPAGQTRADVLVHGYYNNIEATDSLGFELQLVMDDKLELPLYGKTTKAVMMKSCPFNVEEFTGWCKVTSMFLYQYSVTGAYERLVWTEKVDDNTIKCYSWLSDGYDVTINFESQDPLNPIVTMDEDQAIGAEGTFFGVSYGDNRILATHSNLAESLFYPCGKYLYLWAHIYVEDLGISVGTVSHFYNVMEWVSEEEARYMSLIDGVPGFDEDKIK